ncbi:MAG: dihydroorotate dehydrogenase [Deltaproteobacteria bacterium]|nr:dihydroorotate dehydrogenase [Deltaproteobacteria bacterium]
MEIRADSTVDMGVDLTGLALANPVMTASGTFGYGVESKDLVDLAELGAVVTKGLSPVPKEGNRAPRIWEAQAGVINSIGLENPGVDYFCEEYLPVLRSYDTRVVVNFFGQTEQDYVVCAATLDAADGVDALEMNLSCPNVQAGGLQFGQDPSMAGRLVAACRRATSKPLWAKLSLVGPVVEVARACVDAGADVLCLGNTIPAMAIDPRTRRPRLGALTGGLSGPAIHPVAVRAVFVVHRAELGVPLVGIGGIRTGLDAAEFLLAGASAVQVGTQTLVEPNACIRIRDELRAYCIEQKVTSVGQLRGACRLDGDA